MGKTASKSRQDIQITRRSANQGDEKYKKTHTGNQAKDTLKRAWIVSKLLRK